MRPIPAPRLGDSHGILRAVGERERVRLDEFLTSDNVAEIFPEGLENALGRMRQYLSYARAAGLLREDRGVVELTEIGKRYIRAGDAEHEFDISIAQAEWLRRQLFDKHMTDSIFHGLAIGLSLLSSVPKATRISTLDFGRALGYLGRAGWDNENTLQIQGERYIVLLGDMELIDDERYLTQTGFETKAELTLPVHMSLTDIAGQLNPGGPAAVSAEGEAEWAKLQAEAAAPAQEEAAAPVAAAEEAPAAAAAASAAAPVAEAPAPAPVVEEEEDEYAEVGPGAWAAMEEEPDPREDTATVISRDPAAEIAAAAAAPAVAAAPPPAPVAAPPAPAPAPPPAPAPVPEPVAAAPVPAPMPEPVAAAPAPAPAADSVSAAPTPPAAGFVGAAEIRAAAEKHGLRLPGSVYANAAAALAGGRHLLLVGAPGSGKTTLALSVAEAAAGAGRAGGAAVVTAAREWEPADTVLEAAQLGRWLVADDLDRSADLDAALGGLASLLGGLPVIVPGRDGEVRPAKDWRLVATAGAVPAASAALLGRFAVITVAAPSDLDLQAALAEAAGGDDVAAGAARRLLPLRDVRPLGAGVFLAAARHGATRRSTEAVGESVLTRELYAAYVAPQLSGLDPNGEQRVRGFLDAL